MQVEAAHPGLGRLVTGIDLTTLDDAGWAELYRLWLEGIVLVVRGQSLSMEQFLDCGRRFGRLKPHRVHRTRHPEHPELTLMGTNTKASDGTVNKSIFNRGQGWHTDSPWDTEICKGTQLYALAIPSVGGDTLFASMYAAWDTLPEGMKARVRDLKAEFTYGGRERHGIDLLEPADRERPPAIHPIARRHEETGRISLYMNPIHIQRIHDMEPAESDALIAELLAHVESPTVQYRHKWQVGDYVIWDNRCGLHAAAGGYPIEERRIHWRATVMAPLPAESRAA